MRSGTPLQSVQRGAGRACTRLQGLQSGACPPKQGLRRGMPANARRAGNGLTGAPRPTAS